MAWYDITYSCGHEGREQIVGPTKNRQWIADRKAEKLCHDCWEAQIIAEREAANIAAAEQAKEQELPELTGSDKQVVWGNTIRIELIARLQKGIENLIENGLPPKSDFRYDYHDMSIQDIQRAFNFIITNNTQAYWWIDRRSLRFEGMIDQFPDILKKINQVEINSVPVNQAQIEATIRPESPVTETVAEITIMGNILSVDFPEKREDFWQIIKKQLNFKWSGNCWERKLGYKQGAPSDRLVEVGNELLNEGFIVRIYDENLRERAIAGEYKQECTRWIGTFISEDYAGMVAITWGRDEDFYKSARKLPGSKYISPCVGVRAEHFAEIEDFAEMYQFGISKLAKGLIEKAKEIKELAITAKVAKVEKEYIVQLVSPPKLAIPEKVEIDESLLDKE